MGIFDAVIHCINTHFDKCWMFVIILLNTILYENMSNQLETLDVIKNITQCTACMSNEILCVFHSQMVKTSILHDIQKWLRNNE